MLTTKFLGGLEAFIIATDIILIKRTYYNTKTETAGGGVLHSEKTYGSYYNARR